MPISTAQNAFLPTVGSETHFPVSNAIARDWRAVSSGEAGQRWAGHLALSEETCLPLSAPSPGFYSGASWPFEKEEQQGDWDPLGLHFSRNFLTISRLVYGGHALADRKAFLWVKVHVQNHHHPWGAASREAAHCPE